MKTVEDKKWQGYARESYLPKTLDVFRKKLENLGMDLTGKSILDVGCGAGQWLRLCSEYQPARLIGSDFSSVVLQTASERGALEKGISLIHGDAMSIPMGSNQFDLVICSLVLPFVPSDQTVIAELARVCKPGGRMLIGFHGMGYYLYKIFSLGHLKYLVVPPVSWLSFLTGKKLFWSTYQTLPRLKRYLQSVGCVVVNCDPDWSYWGFPFIVYVTVQKQLIKRNA
ncbi:MAG: class I SAM-dependent methyltransferase [Gemmatimonadota bacterium]|nr:class I SAM-dependent methyltransferase [Gemmatimonadota bacterium]